MTAIIEYLVSASSMVISLISCVIAIISFLVARKSTQKINFKLKGMKIEIKDYELSFAKELVELASAESIDKDVLLAKISDYLNTVNQLLTSMYPNNDFAIAIKSIYNESSDMDDAVLVTLCDISDGRRTQKKTNRRLADNTDYSSIMNGKYDYYLISDFDEFNRVNENYKNDMRNWQGIHRSTIVYPIRKSISDKHNKEYNLLGFICIDSSETMRNVQANQMIIKFLENTANELYYLLHEYRTRYASDSIIDGKSGGLTE